MVGQNMAGKLSNGPGYDFDRLHACCKRLGEEEKSSPPRWHVMLTDSATARVEQDSEKCSAAEALSQPRCSDKEGKHGEATSQSSQLTGPAAAVEEAEYYYSNCKQKRLAKRPKRPCRKLPTAVAPGLETLGCSKCRGAKNGCGKCRGKRNEASKVSTTTGRSLKPRLQLAQPHPRPADGQKDPQLSNSIQEGLACTVKTCTQCGTQTTPLWRTGPKGPQTLCNACGVRHKKSVNHARR
ncbi:hypothetical protein WJX84_001871 [Apatococcus fuscideae]|uniref:GATA-type domain-containing protein n=1 Tax=Apatococcus fuscideae TaxID=2026836 RepID=A0AAW1SX80_9CHLO